MKDIITTTDRYKASPSFGEQVLNFATLIDKPRAGYDVMHITGAVVPGQEVDVLEKKQAHGDIWCKVECDIEHEGKTYHQAGWVKRQFLEREGMSYFEQEWNQ